jgi:hypothetical protein
MHMFVISYSPRQVTQYTMPAHQPGAPRLRLLTFVVSVRGAVGSEAQTFVRQISARVAGAAPPAARRGELGHAGLCSPLPLCVHLRCLPGACCWHP